MKRPVLVMCAVAFWAHAGCGVERAREVHRSAGSESDVDAVRRLLEGADRAFNTEDVEGIVANYASDAVLMAPDGPAIKGLDNIRAWYERMFATFRGSHEMTSDEVIVCGDWALDRGTVLGTLTPRNGGHAIGIDTKFIFVLRRQRDGSWKYARVIWNGNAPSR